MTINKLRTFASWIAMAAGSILVIFVVATIDSWRGWPVLVLIAAVWGLMGLLEYYAYRNRKNAAEASAFTSTLYSSDGEFKYTLSYDPFHRVSLVDVLHIPSGYYADDEISDRTFADMNSDGRTELLTTTFNALQGRVAKALEERSKK